MAWALVLSLGPGLFWLCYLYRLHPRPLLSLVVVFACGALAAEGVRSTSVLLGLFVPPPEAGWRLRLLHLVLAVGLLEETWKLLAVRLTVYYSPYLRGPLDGLLYAGCAALGFATAENAVYLWRTGDPAVLLARWVVSTFGHVLMTVFWGYALGLRMAEAAGWAWLAGGLAASALVHGFFDGLLDQDLEIPALILVAGLWAVFLELLQAARGGPTRGRGATGGEG